MLIPLGILAASGAGPVGGDYELIETHIVSGTATTSVLFDSLATYASDYKHLQIRAVHRQNDSAGLGLFVLRFNGDSGTNYSSHVLSNPEGTVIATEPSLNPQANSTGIRSWHMRLNSNSNQFQASVIDILDPYSTTKNKTTRMFSGGIANTTGFQRFTALSSGSFRSTSSTTSLTLVSEQGSFVAGSRFSIYGIRG